MEKYLNQNLEIKRSENTQQKIQRIKSAKRIEVIGDFQ